MKNKLEPYCDHPNQSVIVGARKAGGKRVDKAFTCCPACQWKAIADLPLLGSTYWAVLLDTSGKVIYDAWHEHVMMT